MRKQNQKLHILNGVLLSMALLMIPQAVSAATTPRVDTMPENLVYNGEFARYNMSVNIDGSYAIYLPSVFYDTGGSTLPIRLMDKNNIAYGGHDDSAILPGWNYYATSETMQKAPHAYIGLVEHKDDIEHNYYYNNYYYNRFHGITSSEEDTVLVANSFYKGDYVYQNVAVKGNWRYKFSCLRASSEESGSVETGYDKTDIVLVELDSNKQLLRTTHTFTDENPSFTPVKLATQFTTLADTAYVQIRLVGDPIGSTITADGGFDSFYLAEDEQSIQVNYYAGDADNTANGSLIKSDLTEKAAYTISALSDEEIQAVAPEMYQFTGWKCLENGKIYQNGDSLTLPYADGESGSVTMVAQWILQSYEMGYKLGDVNQDGKISAKDVILLTKYIRGTAVMPDSMLKICDMNGDGRITVKDAVLLCERIRKGN